MLVLALALVLDWFVGEPDVLWKRLPHPVVLFGRVIDWVDRKRFNGISGRFTLRHLDRSDFLYGTLVVVLLFLLCLFAAYFIYAICSLLGPLWWFLEVAVVSILVAQRSLWDHVSAVSVALKDEGLEAGRQSVSMIVGRDVSQSNRSGVLKAALESLAENFSDGVVAPAFWYLVFGLPGILFYKAINTADSMIGHRNEKYEYFGKPAALLDDLLNWPAARISAVLVVLINVVTRGWKQAVSVWTVTLCDAPLHRSPNAGWPEAAFAASLGVALGGPRRYGDETISAAVLNGSGRAEITGSDLGGGLRLFRICCFALVGFCIFFGLLF